MTAEFMRKLIALLESDGNGFEPDIEVADRRRGKQGDGTEKPNEDIYWGNTCNWSYDIDTGRQMPGRKYHGVTELSDGLRKMKKIYRVARTNNLNNQYISVLKKSIVEIINLNEDYLDSIEVRSLEMGYRNIINNSSGTNMGVDAPFSFEGFIKMLDLSTSYGMCVHPTLQKVIARTLLKIKDVGLGVDVYPS